jgi:adenylate kinase family enzyme
MMHRVAIVGSGGAGKSTLARALGAVTGLPVYHLDRFILKNGWEMVQAEEEERILQGILASERWIIDGNYGRTAPARFAVADTIIFLDLPAVLCTWRIIRRAIEGVSSGSARPDVADGCIEEGDWEFIKWVWNFPRDSRPTILKRIEAYGQGAVIHHLQSKRAVRNFFSTVRDRAPVEKRIFDPRGASSS